MFYLINVICALGAASARRPLYDIAAIFMQMNNCITLILFITVTSCAGSPKTFDLKDYQSYLDKYYPRRAMDYSGFTEISIPDSSKISLLCNVFSRDAGHDTYILTLRCTGQFAITHLTSTGSSTHKGTWVLNHNRVTLIIDTTWVKEITVKLKNHLSIIDSSLKDVDLKYYFDLMVDQGVFDFLLWENQPILVPVDRKDLFLRRGADYVTCYQDSIHYRKSFLNRN